MEELNRQLETRTDYESDEYSKIIEQVSELSEKYYSIEEINFDAEVEKTLMGLGFLRSDFTRPTSEFSGGWRMRIELADIMLQKPDLILLDEPTNHMDIESIQWLEEFLITNAKAVIVISHDKTFVDNLTNGPSKSRWGGSTITKPTIPITCSCGRNAVSNSKSSSTIRQNKLLTSRSSSSGLKERIQKHYKYNHA